MFTEVASSCILAISIISLRDSTTCYIYPPIHNPILISSYYDLVYLYYPSHSYITPQVASLVGQTCIFDVSEQVKEWLVANNVKEAESLHDKIREETEAEVCII